MPRVSGSIANLANGISQQASALRMATQGDLQINGYSTVVDGLKKRPPTQLKAYLGSGPEFVGETFTHIINRDTDERYYVLMNPTSVRVFDLVGNEKTVTAPNGLGYLSYTSAEEVPYRAITIGDYTFISNTQKVTAMDTSVVEPISPSEALINVLAGNYGKNYTIKINGVEVARYRTPDGQSAAQAPGVDVTTIAQRLTNGFTPTLETTVNGQPNGNWAWKASDTNLSANGINATNGWIVDVIKSTIYIKRSDGANFTIEVDDGYNGNAMKAIKNTVQDFADLPEYCRDGVAVEITGAPGNEFDNYYVRFSATDPATSLGVWKEIPKPGLPLALDASTMPHGLIRQADGTFVFKQLDWGRRKAGDDATVPLPSFIGRTISELLFFKNRLGFLSYENTILGRAGDYFDWFRATATALLDDDPIDVAATHPGVSVLRSASAFSDKLVLFADQAQFVLAGNELLTPKTASIRLSTSFSSSSRARPVAAGVGVFFPVDRGQHTMIREFTFDPQTGEGDAQDITGHVPQFIPSRVRRLAASTHEDILMVLSKDEPDALYVYKYYWANDQKLQASWSKWTFPDVTRIIDMAFINSSLYMVMARGNDAYIEMMEVQAGGVDPYSNFVVNLDRNFTVDTSGAAYDPFEDRTTVTMPRDITGWENMVCVSGGVTNPSILPGIQMRIISLSAAEVVIDGDVRGTPLVFGTTYEMRYRFSTVFIRQEGRNGGVSVMAEGRLQLLKFILQYSKTAYFKVEVSSMGREVRSYVSSGRLMGDPDNRVDIVNLADGTFEFPVFGKNDRVHIEVVSDSYLPCAILSAEWVAMYSPKSQRI